MREIKFRAWDKEFKQFSDMALNYKIADINYYTDYEWMQYTGLKDKNGKEIYEGDIVRVSGHPFQSSIEIDGNYEVGYNEAMDLCCGSLYLFKMRRWAEVIGNIYENPELVKN